MNAYIIILAGLIVVGVALTFVVIFPLLGVLVGGFKILLARARYGHAWEGTLNFHKRLGFTMADGGEKKEKR